MIHRTGDEGHEVAQWPQKGDTRSVAPAEGTDTICADKGSEAELAV